MDIRKIVALQKKMNERQGAVEFDIDLILDESHPKFHWDNETWNAYIEYEKMKGNHVIYLKGDKK